MIKIATIVGARPQFIKAATVSRILQRERRAKEILIHTGQHYDASMSAVFFEELDIPAPVINLGVGSLSAAEQVGRTLLALDPVLEREKPDWVLVYGDTNSTLAGTLAAVKAKIPLAHVEAGLRSFNRSMPEEINRLLTDHAADLLFSPTKVATDNLKREHIDKRRIYQVGDVMYDAVLHYAKKTKNIDAKLQELDLKPRAYILVTIHRAENTDDPKRFSAIWEGLNIVAEHVPVVWPVHPRTRQALEKHKLPNKKASRLNLIDAVSYLEMIELEKNARLIVTDSGGVQKESFFKQVPCVTLRGETEWTELVKSGWNQMVPPANGQAVAKGINKTLNSKSKPKIVRSSWFGDGRAAEKIVEVLMENA